MNNKIYISGPITGHPDWRERFSNAEVYVSQPEFFDRYGSAEMSERYGVFRFDTVSALSYGRDDKSWRWNMRKSVWKMLWCSTVYFLRGWHESRGARIEFRIAEMLGKRMIFEEDKYLDCGWHNWSKNLKEAINDNKELD